MKLKELAERLSCRLEGDGSLEIERVAGLEQAGPGDVTFFANPKYTPALRRTRSPTPCRCSSRRRGPRLASMS
jgi:UDP-3-O-[3-hydroxymyristoyl] glucosamine N-acyltransferase